LVYKDRNPVRAQEIVSTVASEFVKYDIERKSESIFGIIKFINAQIDTFASTFDRYQDSVSMLRLQENFYDKGDDYLGKLTEKSMEYENRFRDFDYDISLLKTFKDLLLNNKEYANLPNLAFKNTTISFEDQIIAINELQKKRNGYLLDATPQHPSVRMIDKQIEEAKLRLNKNLDNSLVGLQTSLDILKSEYQKYMNEILRTPDLQNKFARLDKMAGIRSDFVLNLYSQKSNYLIASAGIVGDYVVLQKATVPTSPISPKENFVKIAGVLIRANTRIDCCFNSIFFAKHYKHSRRC
jgi:tyrosine-protein kinase Etk/Wzc